MKNYIVMLVLACVSMSLYAVNPIKEGNMIAGHDNDIRDQPWCGIQ